MGSTKNLTYVYNCVSKGRPSCFASHMFVINCRHFIFWHLQVSFHKSFCGAGLITFAPVIRKWSIYHFSHLCSRLRKRALWKWNLGCRPPVYSTLLVSSYFVFVFVIFPLRRRWKQLKKINKNLNNHQSYLKYTFNYLCKASFPHI